MTNILCIAGSPRKAGNSSALLDALAHGAEDAGATPVHLSVADLTIEACRGCGACSTTGVCKLSDDMDDVYTMLDEADAIAIATPVYFATVPAVLKALYDRCQPYWVRRYVMGSPRPAHRRPGALLVVGGGGDPFGVDCAIAPTKSVMAVLDVALDRVLTVVGPDARGAIGDFPDELKSAHAMGAELARSARM